VEVWYSPERVDVVRQVTRRARRTRRGPVTEGTQDSGFISPALKRQLARRGQPWSAPLPA